MCFFGMFLFIAFFVLNSPFFFFPCLPLWLSSFCLLFWYVSFLFPFALLILFLCFFLCLCLSLLFFYCYLIFPASVFFLPSLVSILSFFIVYFFYSCFSFFIVVFPVGVANPRLTLRNTLSRTTLRKAIIRQ